MKVLAKKAQIVSVSAGNAHSVALSQSGKVFVWGFGRLGALGLGNLQDENFPRHLRIPEEGVQLENSSESGDSDSPHRLVQICAGFDHTCLLDEEGNVFCCGKVSSYGDIVKRPKRVKLLSPVTQIAAGFQFSAALTKEGEIFTWKDIEQPTKFPIAENTDKVISISANSNLVFLTSNENQTFEKEESKQMYDKESNEEGEVFVSFRSYDCFDD